MSDFITVAELRIEAERLCDENDQLKVENDELKNDADLLRAMLSQVQTEKRCYMADNVKLREQVERLQPKDCEGNVLDIADTVSMLRSEYDGDHEWDDVVVELALTKWGGDRWIVRGSKGEAWACDCAKTGYDEDAYESSDDVEPIANPTLIEAENDKLRELVKKLVILAFARCADCDLFDASCALVPTQKCLLWNECESIARKLGVEVDDG